MIACEIYEISRLSHIRYENNFPEIYFIMSKVANRKA